MSRQKRDGGRVFLSLAQLESKLAAGTISPQELQALQTKAAFQDATLRSDPKALAYLKRQQREDVRAKQRRAGKLRRGQVYSIVWPTGQAARVLGLPAHRYFGSSCFMGDWDGDPESALAQFWKKHPRWQGFTPPYKVEIVWAYELAGVQCACGCGRTLNKGK